MLEMEIQHIRQILGEQQKIILVRQSASNYNIRKYLQSINASVTYYALSMLEASYYADEGDWSPDSGSQAAKQLLARNVKFTALISSNDDMAFGAIKAFRQAGYRLPEDISIYGFDNTIMCVYIYPPLVSVSLPFDKIIEQAIIKIITPELSNPVNFIKGELIIRDSVIKITNIESERS